MRELTLKPFAWGRFLRIALAAVIAEPMVVNFRYVTPHLEFGELPAISPSFRQASGFWILAAIAALLAVNLVLLGWYGLVRLRFTMFLAIVYPSQGLRASWRSCAKQADRLFRVTLLTTLGIVLLLGLLVLVIATGVFGVVTLRTPDGKYGTGVFLVLLFPTVGFAAAIVAACVLSRVVLHDFILPQMAVEKATSREAWHEARRRVRADREGFFSYLLLRALFVTVIAPVLALLAFAVLWLVFWTLGASAAGYNALLEDAIGIEAVGSIALNVILLALGGAAGAMGAAVFGGLFAVFLRAHAIYFYGNRYKALGDLLAETAAETVEARTAQV